MILKSQASGLAAVHRVAEQLEPHVREQFLAAIDRLQGYIDLPALARALEHGDARSAEALLHLDDLPDELKPLVGTLRTIFHGAGHVAVEELSAALGVAPYRFDLTNPRAVRWASQQSSILIQQISEATREGVRTLIANGIATGRPPMATAREIRGMVGLTERQATAVENYRVSLLAEDRELAQVERMTARYGQKLLTQRAKLIARTETIRSSSAGQLESWHQAAAHGLIVPAKTKRRWVATDDDRTCPICLDLDGQEVGFYASFHSLLGPVMASPVHPGDRCSQVLVIER